MGGIAQLLPFTYSMMWIGSLALIGFPFLTGFYSKDVILEVAYANYTISGNFAYWLGVVSALFTSYYSFRLLFLTFLGQSNAYKSSLKNVHDAPPLMAIPLIILAFGSFDFTFLEGIAYYYSTKGLDIRSLNSTALQDHHYCNGRL
jgi:NADH-ubiquinone oxidoreductase chain 5